MWPWVMRMWVIGFQADGFVELFCYGRNPRRQLIIRLGKARATIHQNQPIAIANEINIVYQTGEGLHREGVNVSSCPRL